MGYAHRWFTPTKISDESWDGFQNDWGKVVTRSDLDVLWHQHRADSWTHSDNVEIGNKDTRWQSPLFNLAQAATGGFSYDTQRQPYDAVVCLCLLVAYATLGDEIRIESDGTWEDWKPGRDLYRKIFGYDQTCPWGEDELEAGPYPYVGVWAGGKRCAVCGEDLEGTFGYAHDLSAKRCWPRGNTKAQDELVAACRATLKDKDREG